MSASGCGKEEGEGGGRGGTVQISSYVCVWEGEPVAQVLVVQQREAGSGKTGVIHCGPSSSIPPEVMQTPARRASPLLLPPASTPSSFVSESSNSLHHQAISPAPPPPPPHPPTSSRPSPPPPRPWLWQPTSRATAHPHVLTARATHLCPLLMTPVCVREREIGEEEKEEVREYDM